MLDLIRDFKEAAGAARGIDVSLIGFLNEYKFEDQIQYVDYSPRELQAALTPQQVLQILKDGHERARIGQRLTRGLQLPGPCHGSDPTSAGRGPQLHRFPHA